MNAALIAFSQLNHDDTLYAYCTAGALELAETQATFTLYKDNLFHSCQCVAGHQQAVFGGLAAGRYEVEASLRLASGETLALNAPRMLLSGVRGPARPALAAGAGPRKGNLQVDGLELPVLEIKFIPGGFERFIGKADQLCSTVARLGARLSFYPRYDPAALRNRANPHPCLEALANFYRVDGLGSAADLLALAQELEQLDLVAYCSIEEGQPHPPPPLPHNNPAFSAAVIPGPDDPTADFIPLQGYLQKLGGVDSAWSQVTGRDATVRHLDYGMFVNHEALYNVVAVTNRPATDPNVPHGTASAGVIAGNNRNGGIKGVAHGCNLYTYDTGDIGRIALEMRTGDVISLDIQVTAGPEKTLVPILHNKTWWDHIQLCVEAGAVVIFAGGNGGRDLHDTPVFLDHGDSGGLLVGCCRSTSGLRRTASNYNLYGALNAWGEHVVTAGKGTLQDLEGNDRDYHNDYSGTSSATPLCAACLALYQSFLLHSRQKMLTTAQMLRLNELSGSKEAHGQHIGRRPDVTQALNELLAGWSDQP